MVFITFQAEDEISDLLDEQAKVMGNCSRAAVVRAAVAFFLEAKSAKSTKKTNCDDKCACDKPSKEV